jgi:hypothetical protein
MKLQLFSEPRSHKLVHQLPRGITLSYNLHLAWSIDRWRVLIEENNNEKGIHLTFYMVRTNSFVNLEVVIW